MNNILSFFRGNPNKEYIKLGLIHPKTTFKIPVEVIRTTRTEFKKYLELELNQLRAKKRHPDTSQREKQKLTLIIKNKLREIEWPLHTIGTGIIIMYKGGGEKYFDPISWEFFGKEILQNAVIKKIKIVKPRNGFKS